MASTVPELKWLNYDDWVKELNRRERNKGGMITTFKTSR